MDQGELEEDVGSEERRRSGCCARARRLSQGLAPGPCPLGVAPLLPPPRRAEIVGTLIYV